MKRTIYFLVLLTMWSCQNDADNSGLKNTFTINGKVVENIGFDKVYLSLNQNNTRQLIDSVSIINDTFQFLGKIEYPKKAIIQFFPNGNDYSFILGNESMKMDLDAKDISQSIIRESVLNNEWNKLRISSYEIYSNVDYLYPQMQKARMQNDFRALERIHKSIDSIDTVNRQFLLAYVNQNMESYLSVLILNDLYHNLKKDSTEIFETAQKLNVNFKKKLEFNFE